MLESPCSAAPEPPTREKPLPLQVISYTATDNLYKPKDRTLASFSTPSAPEKVVPIYFSRTGGQGAQKGEHWWALKGGSSS